MALLSELKERRMRTGLLQWQMARKVGVSETMFCKYENEREPIPWQIQRRIDRVFEKLAKEGGGETKSNRKTFRVEPLAEMPTRTGGA